MTLDPALVAKLVCPATRTSLRYDEARQELSRVAILSVLDGGWYVGLCLVDGEGAAVELLWKRQFGTLGEAEFELLRAR